MPCAPPPTLLCAKPVKLTHQNKIAANGGDRPRTAPSLPLDSLPPPLLTLALPVSLLPLPPSTTSSSSRHALPDPWRTAVRAAPRLISAHTGLWMTGGTACIIHQSVGAACTPAILWPLASGLPHTPQPRFCLFPNPLPPVPSLPSFSLCFPSPVLVWRHSPQGRINRPPPIPAPLLRHGPLPTPPP